MTGPRPSALFVLLVVLLVVPAGASGTQSVWGTRDDVWESPDDTNGTSARIVAVVPNPVADGDSGERVVLAFPEPTNVSGWSIDDGESTAGLPNRTLDGRAIATTEPDALSQPGSDATVVALTGHLALSNAGETVVLRSADGGSVDSVTFEDAPEGRQFVRGDAGWTWRLPGRTDLPVVVARDVPARTFVLPDSPRVPLETIAGARERVLLAAYTFSSPRVAEALCAARSRGVRVAVLVEGEPVGGTTLDSARSLDRLVDCGVDVSALGGPGDRYGVHHPKYAVVDDRALVLSENWKPAGVGGRSSRGWGVVLDSPAAAEGLERTFEADAGFRDARPWSEVREGVEFVDEPPANGSFPERFRPERHRVGRIEVLVAPDNAESGIVDLIDGAERSVEVQQVSIGSREHPFVEATVRAARRGVPVSVLLSDAWYVREENEEFVRWLNDLARRESLPIEARLVSPRSRFSKSHVKALIVDREAAVVGSLNWNAHATRENREVVVVLHDREAAAYYARVFRADWRGGVWELPVGVGVAAALASVVAAIRVRRTVRFEGSPSGGGVVPYGEQDEPAPLDGGW